MYEPVILVTIIVNDHYLSSTFTSPTVEMPKCVELSVARHLAIATMLRVCSSKHVKHDAVIAV